MTTLSNIANMTSSVWDADTQVTLSTETRQSPALNGEVTSWLWLPYVVIGVVLAVFLIASFVRFHFRYGYRYRTSEDRCRRPGPHDRPRDTRLQCLALTDTAIGSSQPRYAWTCKNTHKDELDGKAIIPLQITPSMSPTPFELRQVPASIGSPSMAAQRRLYYVRRKKSREMAVEETPEERDSGDVGITCTVVERWRMIYEVELRTYLLVDQYRATLSNGMPSPIEEMPGIELGTSWH